MMHKQLKRFGVRRVDSPNEIVKDIIGKSREKEGYFTTKERAKRYEKYVENRSDRIGRPIELRVERQPNKQSWDLVMEPSKPKPVWTKKGALRMED